MAGSFDAVDTPNSLRLFATPDGLMLMDDGMLFSTSRTHILSDCCCCSPSHSFLPSFEHRRDKIIIIITFWGDKLDYGSSVFAPSFRMEEGVIHHREVVVDALCKKQLLSRNGHGCEQQ